MRKRAIHFVFLSGLVSILLTACNVLSGPTVIQSTPTLSLPLPSPTPTSTLTTTPTFTHEPTVSPTASPSPSPVVQSTEMTPQIPVMPEAGQDGMSTGFGMMLSEFLGQEVVSYNVPTSLETVANFYQTQLTAQGWEWVYTDIGESLAMSRPMPILIQDFKQGSQRLSVVAIADFGRSENDSPGALVLSSQNISGGELLSRFVSLIAGGLDLGPPNKGDVQPQTMHFTSPLLEFYHPSHWLPTDLQMVSFRTDTGNKGINILPEPERCSPTEGTCFVNFVFITRSLFDAPIMVYVYPDQADTTLETFDDQRWANLVALSESSPDTRTIQRPEDLIAPGSLETLEIRSITLANNTPALQHFYNWQQIGLSTPLVSSYILFKRNDTIIEFHTDFTEEEWSRLSSSVQETIRGIEVAP